MSTSTSTSTSAPAPVSRSTKRRRPLLVGGAVCGLVAVGVVALTMDGFDGTQNVPATANIFGAGLDELPQPGGGGAGAPPVMWRLPDGSERVVTFPEVSGRVNPAMGFADFVGPEGDGGRFGSTDVNSFGGISGIVDEDNGMFVVGVFLTDGPPTGDAPPRLDVTGDDASAVVEPQIGQTFAVGDGTDVRVAVPDDATRLFLGFADGYFYKGDPGYYDNNQGRVSVTVEVATE